MFQTLPRWKCCFLLFMLFSCAAPFFFASSTTTKLNVYWRNTTLCRLRASEEQRLTHPSRSACLFLFCFHARCFCFISRVGWVVDKKARHFLSAIFCVPFFDCVFFGLKGSFGLWWEVSFLGQEWFWLWVLVKILCNCCRLYFWRLKS